MTIPVMTLEVITPTIAETLLSKNTNNRTPKPASVSRFGRDMAQDNWPVTGDSIKIDRDGVLVDGQTRCMASIQVGQSFTTYVLRGLDPNVRVHIDEGVKRSLADVLKMQGESNVGTLGAAIRVGFQWEACRNGLPGASMTAGGPYRVISSGEGTQWLETNPGIREATKVADALGREFRTPRGVVAAVVHQAECLAPEDAQPFFESLISGIGLPDGDPILALRKWMTGRLVHGTQLYYHVYFIKAWNAYLTGQMLRTLTWKRGGRHAEQFPRMLGVDDASPV